MGKVIKTLKDTTLELFTECPSGLGLLQRNTHWRSQAVRYGMDDVRKATWDSPQLSLGPIKNLDSVSKKQKCCKLASAEWFGFVENEHILCSSGKTSLIELLAV